MLGGARIWNWLKHHSIYGKLALLAGGCFLASVFWLRIGSYYEGLRFEKSWDAAMVGIPLTFAFALAFLIFSAVNLYAITAKRSPRSSALVLVLVPLLVIGFYHLPLPTYTDGLHDAVASKLDRERLYSFANSLRELEIGEINPWRDKALLAELRTKYPDALGMSSFSPRISLSDDAIGLTYGGALTKHWGYFITDEDICPRPYLPEHMCQKVFDNVWVFHDIW